MTILYRYLTATNSDVLSGTLLENPDFDGAMKVWAFSDNDLATFEGTQFGHKAGRSNIIPISSANAEPNIQRVPCYHIPFRKNVRPIISVGGTVSKVWLIFEAVAKSLPQTTLVTKYFSATNSDVLGSTELDAPEKSGNLLLWGFADVVTSTLEIKQAGYKVGKTTLLPLAEHADCYVDISKQLPYVVPVTAGQKPIISLGGAVTEAYIIALLV